MVFSSIVFLFLFLPLTLTVYYLVGKRVRNLVLLIASLLFYAWGENVYLLIMIGSISCNYILGLLIDRLRNRTGAKICLFGAVIINIGLLSLFKYTNFIVDNLNQILPFFNFKPIAVDPVHLPIGISFFTFQALTYVVDVYRGEAGVQKNPINIGLYIALFPQLIAGPIVRYHDVAKQIVARRFKLDDFTEGVERFIYGLGKKVLIANVMAGIADPIFALPTHDLTFGLAWLGIIAYTLQIYYDFSGYSDMAIGLGRMFGFHFLENFNYPYISQSIQEFWRRWHISLSNWFRDYLYIPLGGNRLGALRTYSNLFIVFFLCGLWHGASWNFVIWGLMHGFFLILERMGLGNWLKKAWQPIRHIYALLVVIVAWVFFRIETLADSVRYVSAMFGNAHGSGIEHHLSLYLNNEGVAMLILGIIFSAPVMHLIAQRPPSNEDTLVVSRYRTSIGNLFSATVALLVLFLSIMRLSTGAYNPFIYFRF